MFTVTCLNTFKHGLTTCHYLILFACALAHIVPLVTICHYIFHSAVHDWPIRPSAEDRAGVATHCWFQDRLILSWPLPHFSTEVVATDGSGLENECCNVQNNRWLLCLPTVWMFHTSQPTDKPILGELPSIHPLDIVLFIARPYTKKQSLGSTWINYILDYYKMSCGQTIFSAFADFAVSYRENQRVWWIWRNGSWTLNDFEERRGSTWSGPPQFGYLRRSVLGR